MYTQRSKYWSAYTWKVQTSYSSKIKGNLLPEFKISENDFEKLYIDIFHKINAGFYHLEHLKENEQIAIETGNEIAKIRIHGTDGLIGIAGSPYEPIEYEYEALLSTIKSALDFISMLLAKGLNRKEDNIVSLANNLAKSKTTSTSLEGKINELLNDKYQTLIDEYKGNKPGSKSKRNFATHQGSLPTGTINIPINNPNASPLLSKVLNPNDPDPHASAHTAQNLTEYCEGQFYKTCDFLIEVLNLVTNAELSPDQKLSVYQKRVNQSKEK